MGYAKRLMRQFSDYLDDLGFHCIELFTVLPESKPAYFSTVSFYEGAGFEVIGRYPELWESGAIKMRKSW